MKGMMLTLAAYALAVAQIAMPTAAAADPGKGPATTIVDVCAILVQSDPTLTFGDCVALLRSDDSAFVAHACDYFKQNGLLESLGLNQGECVTYLRSLN